MSSIMKSSSLAAPFLRISSFFGLAPLRFKPHDKGYVVSISKPMCIYGYILMTVMALASLYNLRSDSVIDEPTSVDVARFVSYSAIVYCLAVSVGVYGAPCRMRRLLKCLSTIALVDQSIDAQYSQAKERRLSKYTEIFIFFLVLVIICDLAYTFINFKNFTCEFPECIVYQRISCCVICCLSCILEIQFSFTAMSVCARFAAVNKVLSFTAKHLSVPYVEKTERPVVLNVFARRLVPADVLCQTVIMRKSVSGQRRLAVSLSDAVQRASFLQGLLCDLVNDINDSYGAILVFTLISMALNMIGNLYFIITEIFLNDAEKSQRNVEFIIIQCLWFVFYLLALFVLVEPCHRTIEESRQSESIVSHMITESPSQGALAARLKAFSRQLVLRHVGYRPMGFFTVNRSLVTSIIGLQATHLVILLQLQSESG